APLVTRSAGAGLAEGRASAAACSAEWIRGAVLMVDLSGFSALAERLSGRGARGAEDLKDLLNAFFGRLVDLVDAHGGHVLGFPGDGALVLWPDDDNDV